MITGQETTDDGERRFVIENQKNEVQNITVTITTSEGKRMINRTSQLKPEAQWIVANISTSTLKDGYVIDVSGDYPSRFESSRGGTGATIIEMGEGRTQTCGGSLTCYK